MIANRTGEINLTQMTVNSCKSIAYYKKSGRIFGCVAKFSYLCIKEDQIAYIMHKPHPGNIIKGYLMRDILNYLIKNNYID